MDGATKLMEEIKARFPADLDYVTALDTTLAVSEGIKEIVKTLFEALVLVIIVVFIFLQGFRATLIPLLAVPVSLVGTFMLFPLLGFSINTLSLFGLVLAIGLVVDDAIVVVEAVEHHIEQGLSPRDAAFKAMEQVSGPVVAIALILAAVFVPTAFIPGITGRMYQQFAVTIAVSVLISAFNALTLSPALSALLLRPQPERPARAWFFRGFNRWFARATDGYVAPCGHLIRKSAFSMLLLVACGRRRVSRLPAAGRLRPRRRTRAISTSTSSSRWPPRSSARPRSKQARRHLQDTPGIKYSTRVAGFSLLSPRDHDLQRVLLHHAGGLGRAGQAMEAHRRRHHAGQPAAGGLAGGPGVPLSPPAIPGIGTSGGVTFMLEDRAGRDPAFLAENTEKFLEAARQRPEFAARHHDLLPSVPQLFADVDRDKVLKQGINLWRRSTRPCRRSWAAPS